MPYSFNLVAFLDAYEPSILLMRMSPISRRTINMSARRLVEKSLGKRRLRLEKWVCGVGANVDDAGGVHAPTVP